MDRLTGKRHDVPRPQLLPWYEGLLVLDAIARSNTRVPWTAALQPILEQERAKYKDGILRSSIYVERQLLTVAVTGPRFVDSRGKRSAYRRQPLLKEPPVDGQEDDGWYKVNELESFLPPWEAFVQSKCGLYQDFYMVHWGPPHNKTDYSRTECGAEVLGATWEPDECLPEDLDTLRSAAKTRWVASQKAREQKQADETRNEEKRKRLAAQEAEERERRRKAIKYNPMDLKLIEDICNSKMGHGWQVLPSNTDENEIKRGWPKSEKEYPVGHRPITPPGPCSANCDCMEDWHMGQKSTNREWLEDSKRDADAQAALDTFVAQEPQQVRRRGLVTKMHYLESIATATGVPRKQSREEATAVDFVKALWNVVGEAAQSLPLSGLMQSDPEGMGVVSAYALVFATCGPITYVPLRFFLQDPPEGFAIDTYSGRVRIDVEAIAADLFERTKPLQLTVGLADVGGENHLMGVLVHVDRTAGGEVKEREHNILKEKTKYLTSRVARKVGQLACPALKQTMLSLFKDVYDFQTEAPTDVPVGRWARTMFAAATAARSAWSGHLVVRPQVSTAA